MDPETTTRMLRLAADGDREALDRLVVHLRPELVDAARQQLRRERDDHTLDPSALVHELYLKYATAGVLAGSDRGEFLRLARSTMRQILIDYARARGAGKRFPPGLRVYVPDLDLDGGGPTPVEVLVFSDLCTRLLKVNADAHQVAELRVYGGFKLTEIANHTGLSYKAVRGRWAYVCGWLARELGLAGPTGRAG